MFGIKDLEVIYKLAGILFVPFFAIARLIDESKTEIYGKDIRWFMEHPWPFMQDIGFVSWVLTTLALFAAALLVVKLFFCWLYIKLGDDSYYIIAVVGFLCITVGLCGLPVVTNLKADPLPSWNPLWHLGFLTFGFTCLKRE